MVASERWYLQQESFVDALEQFASRLPIEPIKFAQEDENIIQLHRKSIEKLRLTEEELSHSEIVDALKGDGEALVDLLEAMVADFEISVDELIEFFIGEDLLSLYRTVHTVRGIALSFGLDTLANQTLEIEVQVKSNQLPNIEKLQKLLNRLQVNIHQAQRLISQYGKQMSDAEFLM